MFNFTDDLNTLIQAVKFQVCQRETQLEQLLVYRFGFIRVPFYNDRLKDGWALNIWTENLPRDEYPHTHTFDLSSYVLHGGLKNMNWTINETPQGDFRLISPIITGAHCEDEDTNRFCTVAKISETFVSRGQHYEVANGVFHTTQITSYPTITLIRRENVRPSQRANHLVPLCQAEPTRKFDYGARDNAAIWREVHTALALL